MSEVLSVPDLDEDLIGRLKRRAERHGRTVAAEASAILRRVLADGSETEMSFEEAAALMRARLAGRTHTPAEILVRETRDEL